MKYFKFNILTGIVCTFSLIQCNRDTLYQPINPKVDLEFPGNFPARNPALKDFEITQYGVELGKKIFEDKRLSKDNKVSCANCHNRQFAFADEVPITPGVHGLLGFRNAPPIQNMFWMKEYMWDGAVTNLEQQPIIPISLDVEMGNTVSNAISQIQGDHDYQELFFKVYGDKTITATRLLNAITQYVLTLVSANSKYDKVMRAEGETFTPNEEQGFQTFQQKCAGCHHTALFTDGSYRNIGFPINPSAEESGRMRVTGNPADKESFRVPSLRNIEYTAPYGSFGQFANLRSVLDYLDQGVLDSDNLDPILKNNGKRIPLTEQEKNNLISFMKTLSDKKFVGK